MKEITVRIDAIELDYENRVREDSMDLKTRNYYKQVLEELPDIIVAKNPKKGKGQRPYILVDGVHRLEAIKHRLIESDPDYKREGNTSTMGKINTVTVYKEKIVVMLDESLTTYRKIILARVQANIKHGLPYTEQDRIRSAVLLSKQKFSQKRIAKEFGVDPSTVSKWLKPIVAEKKQVVKSKVAKLKEKGKSVREISEDLAKENIEVSPSTVHRIIKEQKEDTSKGLPERIVNDTSNYDRCIEHLNLAQRHLLGAYRKSKGFTFTEPQYQRIVMLLESVMMKAEVHIKELPAEATIKLIKVSDDKA